jgi:predicted nuclease of predicted toxin-antitoxin system
MKFLVDECTGPRVAHLLSQKGHDVFSVYEEARGSDDNWIINKANKENRIIITVDKDFGKLVFRKGKSHKGIILLRLEKQRAENKINKIDELLKNYSDKIKDNFIAVTEDAVRIAGRSKKR